MPPLPPTPRTSPLGVRSAVLVALSLALVGTATAQAAPLRPVTAACTPGATCTATPPSGVDTAFTVEATGGTTPAVLEAELNGGVKPNCRDYRERNADWVRFGFTEPAAGATWTKTVTFTGVDALTEREARRELNRTQICFAAPYRFYTAKHYHLTRPGHGGSDYLGVLPACDAAHHHHTPRHANPCVVERTILPVTGGFVTRLAFRVPAGELDPRGSS